MIVLYAVAALVVALDQWTKHLVLARFFPGESRLAIPHLLFWTFVRNTHGAFGLFGSQPVVLIGLAMLVLALFWFAFRDQLRRSPVVRAAFGAIAGGAIGNVIDRVRLGYVVDFVDLRWWPVFNVADSFVTVGVVALVIATFVHDRAAARGPNAPGTDA